MIQKKSVRKKEGGVKLKPIKTESACAKSLLIFEIIVVNQYNVN
jgi:hypothetical protein